jgi:hypothetical protein
MLALTTIWNLQRRGAGGIVLFLAAGQPLPQAGEFWQYFGNFAKMIIFAEYGV